MHSLQTNEKAHLNLSSTSALEKKNDLHKTPTNQEGSDEDSLEFISSGSKTVQPEQSIRALLLNQKMTFNDRFGVEHGGEDP